MSSSYRDLIAWQKAMLLVRSSYKLSGQFPKEEKYGLASQIRRPAVSVPCNIAEGQGRRLDGEFRQFLGQARGSLMELETCCLMAQDLECVTAKQATEVLSPASEVGRILNGLMESLTGTSFIG